MFTTCYFAGQKWIYLSWTGVKWNKVCKLRQCGIVLCIYSETNFVFSLFLWSDTCLHVGFWWHVVLPCWEQPCRVKLPWSRHAASSTSPTPFPRERNIQRGASSGTSTLTDCEGDARRRRRRRTMHISQFLNLWPFYLLQLCLSFYLKFLFLKLTYQIFSKLLSSVACDL